MAMTSPDPSLWWLDDAAQETVDHPPLVGDTTADVVVVGAGVVGLTCATDLAAAGLDVVVLEADVVGAGATGHSTAKLTALQSPRYHQLERVHGPDAARAYAAASARAIAAVADTADVRPYTAVTWSADVRQREQLEAECAAARRAGLEVRWAVPDETHLPLAVGLALDDQLAYDPLAHLRVLADRLVDAGGRLHEGSRVTAVGLVGETRTVATDAGRVEASTVVLATGLPIVDRGLWFARLEPRRSHAMAVEVERAPLVMGISVGGATRSSRPAMRPDGSTLAVVAGGDRRTGEPDPDVDRQLHAWARVTFGGGEVLARWSAQDWRPADGLPLVGAVVPGDEHVLAACGFDKWGLTSGTAAAGVLADRVLGRPADEFAGAVSPARFRPRAASTLARNQATVGWFAARGWLMALAARLAGSPAPGQGVVVREGTHPVAVANDGGALHRCSAVCPHLGGIVRWDPADRGWECPLHGSRFAPDGEVRSGPATEPLSPR